MCSEVIGKTEIKKIKLSNRRKYNKQKLKKRISILLLNGRIRFEKEKGRIEERNLLRSQIFAESRCTEKNKKSEIGNKSRYTTKSIKKC